MEKKIQNQFSRFNNYWLFNVKLLSHAVRIVHVGGIGTIRLKTEILLNGNNWEGTFTL